MPPGRTPATATRASKLATRPPGTGKASMTTTRAPASSSASVAARPERPAPMTSTRMARGYPPIRRDDTVWAGGRSNAALRANPMSLYDASVPQLKKMLTNLDNCIQAATAYAEKRGFDPGVLLTARLAPDQYHFIRQVQSACDSAKFLAARLAGKEPPKHPDTEPTLEEVRQRIATS